MSAQASVGVRLRRVIGLVLVIATPAITFGIWYQTRAAIETFTTLEARRAPGDTIGNPSAAYHAAHARATEANRWRLSGYATIGVLGTLLGIALLLSARARRTA